MLLLPLAAEAAELRVEAPFTTEEAARWEAVAAEGWTTWTARFGVRVSRPRLTVARTEGIAALRDLGRLRDGRILQGPEPSAPGITDDDVVRHEVAHAFLEAACPAVAREAPLVSEAFALFATGDAARRTLSATRFPFAREAREVLLREAVGARGDEPAIQEALARVLVQPGVEARAEETFRGILAGCATQGASAAKDALLALVRGGPRAVVPATTSVLVMDGLSGEILVDEGATSVPSPVGSVLKPFLVATVPAFLESRLARGTVEWRCDVEAGERLSFSDALARSCNGFFLDAGSGLPADSFAAFDALISAVSKPVSPTLAFEARLGLTPGLALSPREVVRLYAWLVASAPFAVDALTKTPVSGTLAGLPDAPFFVERLIALKTGTVRDARGVPHDGWIVAVGPRDADGRPAFLAAVHGSGRAPASLLPVLRRALEDLPPSSVARVQVLGLSPSGIARASCEGGTPMLTRSAEGTLAFGPSALERGSSFACPASALLLEVPSRGGTSRVKRVFGTLHVGDEPEAVPESALPVR
ncbi:MAG: hypothetical protein JNK60_12080, partial [Acidobacteria bacterium]|nr:hypothetical protein [Acidobacteriota bacterium]